jgi:hypothetical protein
MAGTVKVKLPSALEIAEQPLPDLRLETAMATVQHRMFVFHPKGYLVHA